MINYFINDKNWTDLYKDFEILKKLRKGDKLAVKKEGQLETLIIDERGLFQGAIRTVKSIIYGGHNRTAVSSYLERVAEKTEKFIDEHQLLKPDFEKISPEDYEKFFHFLKTMANKMSNVEYGYRDGSDLYKSTYTRFSKARDTCEKIIEENKDKFKDVPSTIDFDQPVEEREYENRLPRGRTIGDIKHLILEAKEDIRNYSGWKKTAFYAASFFAACITGPLLLLSIVIKPITFAVEIYSKDHLIINTPITWLWNNIIRTAAEISNDFHSRSLLKGYARQVLQFPKIEEEHIVMFSELADYVEELDLQSVDLSNRKFEIHKITISIENTIKLIKIAASKHTCNRILLPFQGDKKTEITSSLAEQGFEKDGIYWIRKTS